MRYIGSLCYCQARGWGSVKGDYFCFLFFYVGGKYIGVGIPYCCLSIKSWFFFGFLFEFILGTHHLVKMT